jgi:GAF domain-containing protein/HAMP domain-containing protein
MKTKTKPPRTSRSLSATLALAFLGLSVIVLLISGGLQVFSNLATQQAAVAGKLQLNAQDASLRVSSFIQNKFSIMDTAARLTNLTQLTPDEQRQVLDSLLGRDPAFRQVAVLNAQGQEIAQASRLSQQAGGTLADQLPAETLAQVQQGKQSISAVRVDPDTSEPLVLLAIPATDAFGDFQGTLVAEVNLKFMWDLVDQLQVGESGVAYVVDKQGNLLAFHDTARVLRGDNVANLDEVREYITGNAIVPFLDLTTGIQGLPVVGAYAPLGTPDWAVVTELPWNEAYREAIQGVLTSVVILVVVAVLAGLLGVYVARRLTVPLVSLTGTATRISAGEMELQAAAGGPREVGALAQAFNSMTARLRDLIDTLEVRVEMRTAQIQASADVGRVAASILDPDQVLDQTVRLITERFGFYYAAAFVIDPHGKWAVLREAKGPGEVARVLKQAGHRLELDGNSMVAAAIRRRRPRIALDVGNEPMRFANPLLPDTRSEIALPLVVGEEVFGALDVQSAQAAAFDEASTITLQGMADQIAVALNTARQYRREQARARQTTSLVEAAVELATLTEADDAQTHVLDLTLALLNADGAALWSPIEQSDQLVIVKASGANLETAVGRRVGRNQGAVSEAFLSNTTVRLDPERAQREPWLPQLKTEAQAILAIPLSWRGRAVGVMTAIHTSSQAFTDDDVNAAQLFAAQAAATLENARLFSQVQEALEELSVANKRLTGEAWQAHLHSESVAHEYRSHAAAAIEPASLALRVPVELRGQPIGLVTLEDNQPQRELTNDERSIVENVVQQMALALESARLFEQTQSALGEARRLAQRERLINRITSQLRSAVTVDEVLHIAADEMRHSVQAAYTAVKLTPPTGAGNGKGDDYALSHPTFIISADL